MTYEVIILGHLHMPLYFIGTFTEYSSLDVKVDAWRKAIETDGLPWLHMSDLKGWNSIVTDVYQIHGIPMLFVLDENNRIVGEGLRGEELEKCVQKVLAQ